MTNREKFKEVFGFDLNTDHMDCIAKGSCKDCPLAFVKGIRRNTKTGEPMNEYAYKYDHCPKFWDDEYVEHDCTNCRHGDTDDTELPCRECGVGPENKWESDYYAESAGKYIHHMLQDVENSANKKLKEGKSVVEVHNHIFKEILGLNEDCTKDCHKYDMDSEEPPCEDYKLVERMDKMDQCMDNYDRILKIQCKEITALKSMLEWRNVPEDITKRIAPEPMCDIHKDGILGRVGD